MHISLSSWNCLEYGHSYSITALSSRWETASQNEGKSAYFLYGREIGAKICFPLERSVQEILLFWVFQNQMMASLQSSCRIPQEKQTNKPTTFFLMDSRDLLWGETGHGSQLWPVFCKQFGKAVCKTRDTGVQGAQQTWKHQMLELPTLSWLMKCYQLVEPFQVTMTISFSRLWRIPAEDASLSSTDAHDLWPQFTLLTVVCNHSWATGQVHTKNTPLMLRGNGDDALPWGAWMGVVQITIISYRV